MHNVAFFGGFFVEAIMAQVTTVYEARTARILETLA